MLAYIQTVCRNFYVETGVQVYIMNMKFFLRILIIIMPLCAAGQDYGHKPGYNLVWFDEFRDSVNTFELWQPGYPWGQWTGGLAYFNREGNHAFDGDTMSIITKREYVNGEVAYWDEQGNYEPYYKDFDYSSGILYSKKSFLRGYFECRFRVPRGRSFNSAFWLYGPQDAEIDVFEILGSRPNRAQMTLHWRGNDPLINSSQSFTYLTIPNPSFADAYHTMAALWDSTQVKFFYNGQVVQESSFTNMIRSRHVPTVPLNVILTNTVGGLDGNPDSTTPFPAFFHVDHVRVYQNELVIPAPSITGQSPLKYFNYNPLRISEKWLSVQNYYKTYPYGFHLEVLPGDNYTVNGQEISVNPGFRSNVFVNIRVNDGINNSAVYRLLLEPAQNVGLDFITLESQVSFYPNPADDLLVVSNSLNNEIRLDLYAADGRKVMSVPVLPGTHGIGVDSVDAGIYIAVFTSSDAKTSSYRASLMIR
jgi:beta-glucanase (GH16 family)